MCIRDSVDPDKCLEIRDVFGISLVCNAIQMRNIRACIDRLIETNSLSPLYMLNLISFVTHIRPTMLHMLAHVNRKIPKIFSFTALEIWLDILFLYSTYKYVRVRTISGITATG